MAGQPMYLKEQINEERDMSVYKRDDMIQKGRFKLSVQEQRAVLYAISKIQPTDDAFTEYKFDIKHFYKLCGIDKDTYTTFKKMLEKLSDNGWWATMPDGTETRVRWFSTVDINKKSGIVTLKFHERMMPYLLKLTEQGEFYTYYNLKYVLPMSSKHSPRLYEILKSYQKNNSLWYFDTDKLKKLMDCENYKNFTDFKRFALDPAVKEINEYTDICIGYTARKEGVKVTRIEFYMDEKTLPEKLDTENKITEVLDGQLDIFGYLEENRDSAKTDFVKQRMAAKKAAAKK